MAEATPIAGVLEVLTDILTLPGDAIAPSDDLATAGLDSVALLETVVALETRYDVRLDFRSVREVRSAADLAGLISAARSGGERG